MNRDFTLRDGRTVDVLSGGAQSGPALVLHHGTPVDSTVWRDWDHIARQSELQLLAVSRAGYATSTRRTGRRVADVTDDIAEILHHIRAPWFVTAGWSGGGPHALACAARLDGCRAAATLAGVAPSDQPGLEFTADMGPENVAEFAAALAGESALRAWMDIHAGPSRKVTGADLIAAFGGLVPAVDREVMVGDFADAMAAQMRRALAAGVDGWIDDDLAFSRPWGFDVRTIAIPVTVWQGDLDLMVPFAHGRWLADHIPGAVAKLVSGHGHISLVTTYREAIVADLIARSQSAHTAAPFASLELKRIDRIQS